MCSIGRCVEGVRYTNDAESDDRFHNDLSQHPEAAMRNALKMKKNGFLDRHEDCDVCSFIRMGF